MKRHPKLILALFLPIQILGIFILSKFPNSVEQWYSLGLYQYLSYLERSVFGLLPFSFGDLIYALFIILLLRWFFLRIKTKFKHIKVWFIDAVATLSVIYFMFQLFWGFNYYREPLHISLGIEDNYTDEQLITLTNILIERSNELQLKLAKNDSTAVAFNYSKDTIYDLAISGYSDLKESYPELKYNAPSVKTSLFSVPLSYMGFNGYLNPLTNESQINSNVLPYKLPTTISHEIGHQLGYAKENEANFIACLNTLNHNDIYMRYSGYTFALRYCLNEIFRRDPAVGVDLLFKVNCGIMANYNEVRNFWLSYENQLEPLFALFYDGYLKANNQPRGMASYSYVVALLVNYDSDEKNLL